MAAWSSGRHSGRTSRPGSWTWRWAWCGAWPASPSSPSSSPASGTSTPPCSPWSSSSRRLTAPRSGGELIKPKKEKTYTIESMSCKKLIPFFVSLINYLCPHSGFVNHLSEAINYGREEISQFSPWFATQSLLCGKFEFWPRSTQISLAMFASAAWKVI